MILTAMMETDKTALICDLAETYGVFDMYALPVETLAALAVGLREDSRIVMKMSGAMLTTSQMLLTGILDGINLLCWLNSEDGRKGQNRPEPIMNRIQGKLKKREVQQFNSGEDFERERQRILAGVSHV